MNALTFNYEPSKAEVNAFHEGFRAFNQEHAPADHKPFAFTVELDGEVLGGIDGASFWDRLHVENLHVEEGFRGQGIGRRLMEMAETLARERGCLGMTVDTFSFQAPGFYPKFGFEKVGEVHGYVKGHSRIYYQKRF